jgi:3-oxoacyl-[acyl-carrier protein] reductase
MRLAGRVALVTGSSRGIGRAIAIRFAHEGADLVVNGRSPERVQHVCAELGALGRRALPMVADVTDEAAVEGMVDAAIRAYGRIDILVNNVGGTQPAAHRFLEDYGWDSWQQILALNLTSQFLCCRAVAPHMKRRGYGRIINVSSIAGVSGVPLLWSPPYAAAKAAVIGFTKQMAQELGHHGIAANALVPLDVATERLDELAVDGPYPETPQQMEARYRSYPVPRLARADEVARVALFLASEDASYITGDTLIVGGGSYVRP